MCIDIADARAGKCLDLDKSKNLVVGRDQGFRQFFQIRQDLAAIRESAECQFPDNERMGKNLPLLEKFDETRIVSTKMINPDRRVDQDHNSTLRRGTSFRSGSLPPRRASRRALSLSMSAFNASRTIADFSVSPV